MSTPTFLEQLAGGLLMRRLTDAVIGRFALRRVAQIDRRSTATVQRRTLLRLVRYAQHTRFGREHDFARIRTIADYQRRVPLRDYEAFWRDYWCGLFPFPRQATWPDRIPYYALSSGTTSGATKYIPISRQMLASNQQAAVTTLALFLAAHPGTPLFSGRLFFLGGSTDLEDLAARGVEPAALGGPRTPVLAGDLSGIVAREVSPLLRPYTFPPPDLALLKDWEKKLDILTARAATLPVTMLSGVPSWLLVLFDRLLKYTGRARVTDVWPMLRLVIHGGTKFDPYRALFQQILGPQVHLLDTYPSSEGYIASEDPRYGLLRLLPDHNVFFEFVPVAELDRDRPTRHTAAEVEPGVQYAVVLTTCAGLWSYVVGDTVCFERRDPPLLRFTGRTKYFLSAFGEHLISEEVERAVAAAALATNCAAVDFHVGPLFPTDPAAPGRHRYFVEFAGRAPDLARFGSALDAQLCKMNEDYAAHRAGDLTLLGPDVIAVPAGGFADWLRSQGKLGGQHKVPRMDNSGEITGRLGRFFGQSKTIATP